MAVNYRGKKFYNIGPWMEWLPREKRSSLFGHFCRRGIKKIMKFFPGLGDEIDPAMMAALMATTALVARGASNEEVRSVRLFHFKGILTLANMGYILLLSPEKTI